VGGGLEAPEVEPPPPLIENGSTKRAVSQRDFFKDRRKKRTEDINTGPLTPAQLSTTYIDPFHKVLSKSTLPGEKRERVEVWHDKLEMLKQLTPREDLEGYEIREDYHMQQARLAAQADFQQRMRAEILRREENPTEIEQVEDVLYDLVDAIARNSESAEKQARLEEKRKQRGIWHPAVTGFKMKRLGATVSESGAVTMQVSDFPFSDFMISPTGRMLAVRAPPELFELHEQERKVKLEAELRRIEEEELERKRPLKDKLRIAVALARHDPAGAAQKAANDVLERATRWPRTVSERLMEQSKTAIARGLAGLMRASEDPQSVLEDLSETIVTTYRNVLKRTATALASPVKKRPRSSKNRNPALEPSIKDVEEIINQEEEQARQREELLAALRKANMGVEGRQPVPVEHADAVQVTVTLLCSPPPAYTMRPPPSWRRDLIKAKKKAMRDIEKFAQQAGKVLQRLEESDAGFVLRKLVAGEGLKAALQSDVTASDGTVKSGMPGAARTVEEGHGAEEPPALPPADDAGSNAELPEPSVAASGSVQDNLLAPSAVKREVVTQLKLKSILKTTAPGNRRADARGSDDSDVSDNSGEDDDEVGPLPGRTQRRDQPSSGEDNDDGMHTSRSRNSQRSSRSRSGRSVLSMSAGMEVPTDYPLDHEDVHPDRIRHKRHFAGSLKPEDMIPKAFQVGLL
jgi:hypothetical protein